jgi:HD superfamily phosphohydrolase
MPSTEKRQLRSHSSFGTIYDAVHGPIDLRDTDGSEGMHAVVTLLSSPMVDRLRRIKQLGYASHSYLSADHSRHAHALGTMYVMRTILRHLSSNGETWKHVFKDLTMFGPPKVDSYSKLVRHMLIAALLQDVGELPYGQSTGYFYKPSDELRELVATSVGYEISNWHDKDIFTIASIYADPNCKQLGLNLAFLTFLITGNIDPSLAQPNSFSRLRHVTDGEVDADRLDYVFRDAHQTIGGRGTPNAVIESLLYYDEIGPVFSDPGPVSDFFTTRASLWTSVYFSAQNRFRILLLITLLQGIISDDSCSQEFFGGDARGELSITGFQELDDASLSERIRRLDQGRKRRRLNPRATFALDLLTGRGPEYECVWLPHQEATEHPARELKLPADLFFDSYSDYRDNHPVYEPGTIRVKADRFRYYKSLVPLEDCCGAFSQVFKRPMSVVERPDSILLFLPKHRPSGAWTQFQRALDGKWLFQKLTEMDPIGPLNFVPDTRGRQGFKEPDIFISFNWADSKLVSRVAQALYNRRRKYYLYIKTFQGVGGTPGKNSIEAVMNAGAVILLASSDYVKRYQEEPNGNIAKEINAMSQRVKADNLKVIVLSADHFSEIEKLPWSILGFEGIPYIGAPLRNATNKLIGEAVDEALEAIDSRASKGVRRK